MSIFPHAWFRLTPNATDCQCNSMYKCGSVKQLLMVIKSPFDTFLLLKIQTVAHFISYEFLFLYSHKVQSCIMAVINIMQSLALFTYVNLHLRLIYYSYNLFRKKSLTYFFLHRIYLLNGSYYIRLRKKTRKEILDYKKKKKWEGYHEKAFV